MENLTKIDEIKLAEYLKQWFNQNNISKDHFWERNPVAVIIKNNLKSSGKWRNRARGNPRKGYKVMVDNRKKKLEW
jgi:hypothetical protein